MHLLLRRSAPGAWCTARCSGSPAGRRELPKDALTLQTAAVVQRRTLLPWNPSLFLLSKPAHREPPASSQNGENNERPFHSTLPRGVLIVSAERPTRLAEIAAKRVALHELSG